LVFIAFLCPKLPDNTVALRFGLSSAVALYPRR
jgi:hypothetical protein